jgi:dynein heavy chain
MKSVFDEINVEEIKQYSDKYSRIISKCTKKLPTNPVLNSFKKLLSTFKDSMPVVIALSNKKLQ